MTEFSPITEVSELFDEIADRKIENNCYYNSKKISKNVIKLLGEIMTYKTADIMWVAEIISDCSEDSTITEDNIKRAAGLILNYEPIPVMTGAATLHMVANTMPNPYQTGDWGSSHGNMTIPSQNGNNTWPSSDHGSAFNNDNDTDTEVSELAQTWTPVHPQSMNPPSPILDRSALPSEDNSSPPVLDRSPPPPYSVDHW